jgi:dienelactone hydrolase
VTSASPCLIALFLALPAAALAAELGFYGADGKPVERALLGDELRVRVSGLAPGSQVHVEARSSGSLSEAWFTATADGSVDLAQQAPQAGTYPGVDPDGLFWSMKPAAGVPASLDVEVRARVGGELVARRTLPRAFPAPGVKSFDVKDQPFVGRMFLPPGAGPFPGLVVFGGGEGGIEGASFEAAHLASHGFAALAVAYFGLPGLPDDVHRIRIEYFGAAVKWLRAHPATQGRKLGAIGGSRGGEVSLLVGIASSDVSAVVSEMGSPIAMSAFLPQTGGQDAPWTFQGKPLPYVRNFVQGKETYRTHPGGVKALEFASTRDWKVAADPSVQLAAVFPVEKIRGPVLFAAGEDDTSWPSSFLSRIAFNRLKAKGHPYADEIHIYPQTGHVMGNPPGLPSPETYIQFPGTDVYLELGGTPAANARAQRDSTRKIIRFLRKHLQQNPA